MKRLGVVVALASEAKVLGTAPGVEVMLSGMGPQAAAKAARGLADSGVAALAVFGVAGALDSQCKAGDLLCPAVVFDEQGGRHDTDAAWRARLRAHLSFSEASLLSVRQVLASPLDKSLARSRSGAVCVDMESAAVAAIAHKRGLPLLVLRAISDEAQTTLPQAIVAGVDVYGHPRASVLLRGLLRQPSALFALPRLAAGMNCALKTLASVIEKTGPELGWKP